MDESETAASKEVTHDNVPPSNVDLEKVPDTKDPVVEEAEEKSNSGSDELGEE